MSARSVLKLVASLAVASTASAQVGSILAPTQDINFPAGVASTLEPLHYAGANSPWFKGPDVYEIPYEVPEGCTVQQAAYTTRHGSRFPDSGSYNSWVALQAKIQAATASPGFSATGDLAFIPDWQTVLTNEPLQISQQSMTGFKEAHDLGYQLRARYPDFYKDGNDFMVWANQYASPINESRVVQTARAFLQGYLYVYAETYGTVVAVNSTGSAAALGDSLSPADLCPAYTNNAVNNVTDFDALWMPDAIARMNSMVTGNLTFTENDLTFFPYLCGYESQITGRLSPWCGVFNDTELLNYQYSQDLAYYYGVGPGSSGAASKTFLPYLDELMSLLLEGPGQQGVGPNGNYTVPDLIMSFLNDNQIAMMTSVMGLFDDEKLPIDHYPGAHPYDVSHFITMRGTVAFEVLNCAASAPLASSSASFSSSTTGSLAPTSTATTSGSASGSSSSVSASTTGLSNSTLTASTLVPKTTSSNASGKPTGSGSYSGHPSGTQTYSNPGGKPTPSGHPSGPESYSTSHPTSAASPTIITITQTHTVPGSDCAAPTPTKAHKLKRSTPANELYIRIILNDAVYPVLDCQSGPGNSCLLTDYAAFIHEQNEAAGNFVEFCNVTAAGSESAVVNGASFYKDLTLDYLTFVKPSGELGGNL